MEFFEHFLSQLLSAGRKHNLNIIMVSNEVGLGLVPPYPFGRVFRDMLGLVNKKVAAASDEVYFFVAGLKMKIK
jgi:adenosylcobinamide kinase/adenosylcobinamide-phosphate guanylyltransferase